MADRSDPLKKQRFVKIAGQTVGLEEVSIERARQSAGYKGYVTNVATNVMDGHALVAAYHDLWKVEQSFRMATPDLKSRPIFHRTRDSTEAHLTIVFAALALPHYLQNQTGMSITKIVRTPHRIHTVDTDIDIDGHAHTPLTDHTRDIITAIPTGH